MGSARDRAGAPLRLAAQAAEVHAAVLRLRPRCVIGWSMRGLLSSTAALATVRSAPPLVFAHNDLMPSAGVARVVRAAARRCVAVVALSAAIADDLGLPATVIHPGVDLERFSRRHRPTARTCWCSARSSAGSGPTWRWRSPPGAGSRCTSRARPLDDAGQDLLERLRARADRPDLRGRVQIPGHGEDAAAALEQATCLLHCADREPFGLVMAEALASGRAGGRAGGRRSPGDRRRQCGALYRPGDAEAGARALSEVLERAPELGASARARAQELFDVKVSNRRFAELIAGLDR